jgi:hypothetical protein
LEGIPRAAAADRLAAGLAVYSHGATRGCPVHLNLGNWRNRVWPPAVDAAGLQRGDDFWLPDPYTMQHAFATWMLDAGIELFELARLMGTVWR